MDILKVVMISVLLLCAVPALSHSTDRTDISGPKAKGPKERADRNVYDFIVSELGSEFESKDVALEDLRGKVLLIVNVASNCGFTEGHYKGLVHLQELLSVTKKFTVLAFPCNQFGGQEPKSDDDIRTWAKDKFGVNFPLFSKINVIEPGGHPLFRFLSERTKQEPNWNFWKYLVNHEGVVVNAWGPWNDIEEITPLVKDAVNMALEADPETPARGPPQPERADYGDGANTARNGEMWSEGFEGYDGESQARRAGTNENEDKFLPEIEVPKAPAPLKRSAAFLKQPGQAAKIIRPGSLPRNLHEDL